MSVYTLTGGNLTIDFPCGRFPGMSVFRDRGKLSSKYVPERLPHRDAQLAQLREFFRDLAEGRPYFKVIQLIGHVGAGKTSSVLLFSREAASRMPGVRFIYVNLRALSEPSPFLVYSTLLTKIGGRYSRSLSAGEVFLRFVRKLRGKGSYVIVMDEADELSGSRSLRGGRIVYNLTRLPELGAENVGGVVFVSRRRDWQNSLAAEERSSLGSLIIYYPRYSRSQIVDILRYRASEAFREGAVADEVLEYVADLCVNYLDSDLRKALDVLLYAGIAADMDGSGKVDFSHVAKALRNVLDYQFVSADVYSSLTLHEKITLYSVVLALENSSTGYAELSRVKEYAEMIYEAFSLPRPRGAGIEVALQKLYDLGLVGMNGPLKLIIPVELDVARLKKEIWSAVENRRAAYSPRRR